MYDDQPTNAMEPLAPSVSQTNTDAGAARPMGRLDAIVENLSTRAAPVVREIAARGADLAAKAGEAAGPLAHRAAEKTEVAGGRFADRSREFATDLRQEDPSASPRSTAPSPADSV